MVDFVDIIELYFSVMFSTMTYIYWFYIYVYYDWMINIHEVIKLFTFAKMRFSSQGVLSTVETQCARTKRAMTELF